MFDLPAIIKRIKEMKLRDGGLLVMGILVGIGVLAGVISQMVTKKNDGPIEEIGENIIKYETGIDIDLSPGTPDPDFPQEKTATVTVEGK
jgi:hypothetical protein